MGHQWPHAYATYSKRALASALTVVYQRGTRVTGPLTAVLEDLVYACNRDLKSRRNAFQRFAALVSFDDGLVALS